MDNLDKTKEEFIKAYDELSDKLFRRCFFKVSDREKAKDLVQETFFKGWRHIARGKEVSNVKAFLYKIADNLVIDHYRKTKEVSLDDIRSKGFDRSSDDHNKILIQTEHKRVIEILDMIPKHHKEIIIWRFVEGWSLKEISEIIGTSENTVSVRLNRALKTLRLKMNL